ncbi:MULTISPECIES: NACHT domain-containing NTPase [unclassified Treponema]|uniref:NACHT domain-containing protein n=1 Tax=unclassified Treponema TaxID=2638727 RepID=UPI0020A3F588|nr:MULTISPECIES: hypothetical protein [unclassified Treponema]UTC66304.1 hypothetical protein E4O06_10000 [Treponema sp. OMZ 789]UTC69034.1 hypothetical protein E4O01_10150 [Treponema sp. OMZ 790]UTC71746.1 hypothetical protein E4O02_10240 [Treponema sp. OMZ 791]
METFYRKALEDLNTRHDGSTIFEEFCHIIVRIILPDYHFSAPAGGKGTSDGGRDGFDANKNARMACSIQKEYSSKIKDELKKTLNEKELFFFSNQAISELDKVKYEKTSNIKLHIFSLEDLVTKIKAITSQDDERKVDYLLRLSIECFDFVKDKLRLHEKTIQTTNNEIYTSKLMIENTDTILITKDPVGEYLISQFKTIGFSNLPHFFLKGQCGIGKTFLMKQAHNTLLNCAEKDLNFKALPLFFDLKDFPDENFKIPNKKNIFLIFLDGLDEISEENKITLSHKIHVALNEYQNIRFIIAGRDGAFNIEISNAVKNNQSLILTPYNDRFDEKLAYLMKKYNDSPVRDLLTIPLYRNYFIEHNDQKFNSSVEFYKSFVFNQLETDKEKFDEAEKIPKRMNRKSKINIEHLAKKLQKLCYQLFCKSKLILSKQNIMEYFTEDEYLYLIQSSLLHYTDDNTITFISAFYFEYFTACFFELKSYSDIKKIFFINGGKDINVRHLNIFMLFLNILDRKSKVYKKICIDLEKLSPCYILLTDFELLPSIERYKYYISILNYYDENKKHIYYTRFYQSADLLANIPSLSSKMMMLLPESYYEKACALHIEKIQNFLKKPHQNTLMNFANAIILLGVYDQKIWNASQQNKIKDITIPLFQFFLNNPLAKKLSGLLSVDSILYLYSAYDWTKNWNLEHWNDFFKTVSTDFNSLESPITGEKEFSFKLKMYNEFQENPNINVLLYPVITYLLKMEAMDTPIASPVPTELDDTYNTPMLSNNYDLFYLKHNLENTKLTPKIIIDIFSFMAENKIETYTTTNLEYSDVIKILYQNFKEVANILEEYDFDITYKILLYLLDTRFHAFDINNIHTINDTLKKRYIKRLCKDIVGRKINYVFLMPKLFSILLDINDQKQAITLFETLNCPDFIGIYKDVVYSIMYDKIQTHILTSYIQNIYETSDVFEQERFIRKEKEEKQKQLTLNIEKMTAQEEEVMLNKGKLLSEIDSVFEFLDTNNAFHPNETERSRLLYLCLEYIHDEIELDNKNTYKTPPVFSSFVINFLFDVSHNDKKIDREALKKYIYRWFEADKYYWRFMFYLYIKNNKHEEANNFIRNHKLLYEKIEKSMKQEITEFMEICSISDFTNRELEHPLLTPFIYYLQSIYNNTCPNWFDTKNILVFCFISCWYFSLSPGMRITTDFTCGKFSSIYDWLSNVFRCTNNDMLEYCLENLDIIQSDHISAQCIDFILKNIDNDRFKNKIESLLLSKTKHEILDYKKKNSSSTVNTVLSIFWKKCKNNQYVKAILEMQLLDIEQINEKNNHCQAEIENYIIKYASCEQKQILIKEVKKKLSNENIVIFLAKLGYKKAIYIEIDKYLKGKTIDQDIWSDFVLPFGFMKKNTILLNAFISLFTYSIAESNDRRQCLFRISCRNIRLHLTKWNFFVFKIRTDNLIKKLQEENKHYQFIENFQKEMMQYLFSNK